MRFFAVYLASISPLFASVWIDANDIYTRADIQILADSNVIKSPVNHWPITWSDISADITNADSRTLSPKVRDSLDRIIFKYQQKKSGRKSTKASLSASTDRPKFNAFGASQKEKGEFSISRDFVVGNFAGRFQTNRITDPIDDKNFRFDGSYLAYKLGNWNITAGYIPMHWGPGWDTALLMSTNARPIPGISINRQQAIAFETPWLSWIGPWTFTSFMGQLEASGRAIEKPLLWSNRLSLRPFSQLEIGLSRSTQWGGEGRDQSLSAFWDIIVPSESDNKINNDTDVNDLGAIDMRFNGNILNQSFGVYYEMGFEDYGISDVTPSKRSHLIGVDTDLITSYALFNSFIEYTDTYHKECACIYEHDIYRTGYTYRKQWIGSTYGKNAETITASIIAQTYNNHEWQATFSAIKLNKDNEGIAIDNPYETYQDILEFRGKYRLVFWNSRWELGVTARRNEYGDETDDTIEGSLKWEYIW